MNFQIDPLLSSGPQSISQTSFCKVHSSQYYNDQKWASNEEFLWNLVKLKKLINFQNEKSFFKNNLIIFAPLVQNLWNNKSARHIVSEFLDYTKEQSKGPHGLGTLLCDNI
jgi:hypothetical protein